MRRKIPSSRWIAVAVAAGCVALAAALSASTPAATDSPVKIAAGHKCLVMTGSGDPTFIKNFNPYTATGLPSGSFVQGAFYEPLIVTAEGGLKPVPWLARSWKWSNGNKTLTLNLARNAKWSDGQKLTSSDVVYSFLAGRQDKLMDRVGLTGAGNEIRLRQGERPLQGHRQAEGARLAVHRSNDEPAVRRAATRLVQDQQRRDLQQHEAGGLRTVQRGLALHLAGLRPQQEPPLLAEGPAEDRVPRVRAGLVERRRARTHPERAGRLDAQLRAERREGVHRQGQEALPRVLRDDGLSDLAHERHDEVPVQHARVPQGTQPRDRPQDRVEAR